MLDTLDNIVQHAIDDMATTPRWLKLSIILAIVAILLIVGRSWEEVTDSKWIRP